MIKCWGGRLVCPLFGHRLTLWTGLPRSGYLISISENIASRLKSPPLLPSPSPIPHMSLYHFCKYFPFRFKTSEWECRGQIFWDFCPFLTNLCERLLPGMQYARPDSRPQLPSQDAESGTVEFGARAHLVPCEHHPSHLGLWGWGPVPCLSDFLVSSLVH